MVKRKLCSGCNRPVKVCLCPWLTKIENRQELIVLRHKSETKHALNSVKILEECLTNLTVYDGECFDENLDFVNQLKGKKEVFMLYPSDDAKYVEELDMSPDALIIVLDGTWPKTRLIRYETEILKSVQCITFFALPKSNYRIRKGPESGTSTLEAVALLLEKLEKEKDKYNPLLTAFEKMIDLQIECMGIDTYNRNYPG